LENDGAFFAGAGTMAQRVPIANLLTVDKTRYHALYSLRPVSANDYPILRGL